MKYKEDKNIESLVEKIMKETTLEMVSFDFTSKVMSEVRAASKERSTSYTPVISKRGWFIIFTAISALITWFIFSGYTENNQHSIFSFSFNHATRLLDLFPEFHFPVVTTNIILLAMFMVGIQIILLKEYWNKRFQK